MFFLGTGGGTRTHGQETKSLLLYQLSYAGSQAKLLKVSVFKLWSRRMLFFLKSIHFYTPMPLASMVNLLLITPISTFSIIENIKGKLELLFRPTIAVGSVVPYVTRNWCYCITGLGNVRYGPQGINLLKQGKSPKEALEILISNDPLREHRQVGINCMGMPQIILAVNVFPGRCKDWKSLLCSRKLIKWTTGNQRNGRRF